MGLVAGVLGVATAIGGTVVVELAGNQAPASTADPVPSSPTPVVRTDLHSTATLAGTLTWDGQTTLSFATGTSSGDVAQAEQSVSATQVLLSADQVATTDAEAAGVLAIRQQLVAVGAAQAEQARDRQQARADSAAHSRDEAALARDAIRVRAGTALVAAAQHRLDLDTTRQAQHQRLQLAHEQAQATVAATVASHQEQTSSACGTDPATAACATAKARTAADEAALAAADALANADALAVQRIAVTVDADNEALSARRASLTEELAAQSSHTAAQASDRQALTADGQATAQAAATVAEANGQLAIVRQAGVQSLHQAQAREATDRQVLTAARQTAARNTATALNPGGTVTHLPAEGQVVRRGQSVYSVDGRPIPLLYGTVVPWRALSHEVTDGPDVAQLQTNLTALGFATGPDQNGHFATSTTHALMRWQASVGLEPTGVLRLGDAVFSPGAVRVGALRVSVGAAVAPGTPILDATATTKVVTAPVEASQLGLVTVGNSVDVQLPDGSHARAHVRTLAASTPSSTTAPASGGSATPGPATPSGAATVTIALDQPNAAAAAGTGDVQLTVTDATATGVLAVPVTALLALQEGGDGVEVVSGGRRQIVAVRTGLFAGTLVEISGPAISAGTLVEVPSS